MAEFTAGDVIVPVVPSAKGFITDLKKQLLPGAYDLGQAVSRDIQRGIKDGLGGIYEPLKQQTRRQQQQAPADGAAVGGAFAQGFKRAVDTALKSLPKIQVDADTSPAQAQVQALRARLETLSGKTVGVDIDAAAAQAEIAAIQRELAGIDGRNVSADLQVDIASALAELAAIDAGLSQVDGRVARARVDVDVSGAIAAIASVTAALAAVPVAATAAVGAGALGGVFAAAGAGLAGFAAVAAPSLGRINEALKEQENAAPRAASALRQVATETRNLAIESAQAQIKQLQAANAADALRAAQDRVKVASQGVAQAKARLKSAVTAAGQAQQAAAQRAAQAEQGLANAQRNALKAQEALNRARKQAAKDLRDLAQQARSNALDQREAALDVVDAEDELNKVRANKKASAEDIERATIAYERAKLRVEELKTSAENLAEQQAKGVEGQDSVVAAKEAVESANQQIIEQEKAVAQAQVEAGKAGEEAAKRVEDAKKAVLEAEKRVQEAERGVEQVKRNQKIAALQEKIRKEQAKDTARRQKEQAKQAAAAQAAVGAKGTQKTAKLSKEELDASKKIKAFQDSYEAWQKKLAPSVLPVITNALGLVKKLFGPLTPLIQKSSDALSGLEKAAAKALNPKSVDGKFWADFFTKMSDAAPKAITGLGKSTGNIATGIAGVIKAFLPFVPTVVGGIQKATSAFATWGKGLSGSQGFKDFIAYVQTNAPKIITIISNVGTVIGKLLQGAPSAGSGALDMLVSLTDWLARLSPGQLQAVALGIAGIWAAFKGWKIITTAVDGVKKGIQTASTIVEGSKKAWSKLRDAASGAADAARKAASRISSAAKGIASGAGKAGTAVWSGIQTAASKAASVARSAGTAIAGAARTAGAAAARGGAAVWSGIQSAAGRAAAAARTAGTAIATAARTAATAALGLGKVALEYGRIALQAGIARARMLLAAAAQGVVKAATIAWAAAQRILNLALSANPIGLIITAIGLLVAGLIYAWNNSETFRTVVTAAWEGIRTAVSTAWTTVIQPALKALWAFIQNTLAPGFKWLWNSIIVPAWNGISTVVAAAWNGVIQPALKALWSFITTVLAPKISWLWNTVIVPAWKGISAAVKTAWDNVIQPALEGLRKFIAETLAPKISWLWENVIKPAWKGIGEAIDTAWTKVIKPAFDSLKTFITETIPTAFDKGVGMIKTAWDKIQGYAKTPVNFIIGTVYNGGIVKVWNAVADAIGLKDAKLSEIPQLATGGIYPGYTPGKDIGLAAVSGGEAIMRPEWTRAVGEKYVHGANAAARSGGVGGVARFLGVAGDPGFAGAFASGGVVGDMKDVFAGGLKVGAEAFLNPLLDKASAAMGDGRWAKMLVGVPKKLVADVIKVVGAKEETYGGASQHKAVQFARAQIGKPYKWGATGPDSFDCSGLTMRSLQAAGLADVPRVTYDQIKYGKAVSAPQAGDLGFPHSGHVWLYSSASKIIEAPYTGASVRETAARTAQAIRRPSYDDGGYLMPGTSLVHNGTGRPEPVLTDRQWQAISQGGGARGGDGPMVSIEEMHVTPEQSPYAIAGELRYLLGRGVRAAGR